MVVKGSQAVLQLIQSDFFWVGGVRFAAFTKLVDSFLNAMSGYESFVGGIIRGALAVHLLDELVTDCVEVL